MIKWLNSALFYRTQCVKASTLCYFVIKLSVDFVIEPRLFHYSMCSYLHISSQICSMSVRVNSSKWKFHRRIPSWFLWLRIGMEVIGFRCKSFTTSQSLRNPDVEIYTCEVSYSVLRIFENLRIEFHSTISVSISVIFHLYFS